MPRKPRTNLLKRTLRGVSLLETLLALGIGGVVIASSMFGLTRYTENLKVQASASMLSRLTAAADSYASDHFDQLVTNAPEVLPISVLEPYYGQNIRHDAFRTTYQLTTRTYTYDVPSPTGTQTKQALQLLVVGMQDPNGPLIDDHALRADVANTAGAGAGYLSTDYLTCANSAGTGTRVEGQICGAFGSYSMTSGQFPALDLNGVNSDHNDGAVYVSLVTKGDSSVYGDQLYRYDFGDPELNTMHTDLLMDDNNIEDPGQINGLNLLNFDGGRQAIETTSGALNIEPAGRLTLDPGDRNVVLTDPGGANGVPIVRGERNRLQIGPTNGNSWLSLGDRTSRTMRGDTRDVGQGDLYARDLWSEEVRAHEINSLHPRAEDPLRLQNRNNGEVIVGKRTRYQPNNGPRYELSDGKITAQHVQVQDVTCADCGGSLSNLLPRWRHMGTYFISDSVSNPWGTFVPKPECGDTRRTQETRGGNSEELRYAETSGDNRFEPKIVVVPKEIGIGLGAGERSVVYSFYAEEWLTTWRVTPKVADSSGKNGGKATALAATYCVFTGGTNRNPANGGPSNNLSLNNGWMNRID